MAPHQIDQLQLSRLAGFSQPLLPLGPEPSGAERNALAAAIQRYAADASPSLAKYEALENFLKLYPNSSWKPSLRLNLGMEYHKRGRYSLGLSSLQEAWQLLRTVKEPRGKALADVALGQWAISLAHVGRIEELEPLLQEARKRSLSGPATEWITSACEGLYGMQTDPGHSFLCGPAALSHVCESLNLLHPKSANLLRQVRSTRKGTSLQQVSQLAEKLGMGYQMAYRQPGAILLPNSVVHWKVGHYAAFKMTLPSSLASRFA